MIVEARGITLVGARRALSVVAAEMALHDLLSTGRG
jgi:hypothetical protein